jgi:hypothetical protein
MEILKPLQKMCPKLTQIILKDPDNLEELNESMQAMFCRILER